ncbi:MAG: aminopeptidase P family protein, partial [Syntrophomonadaceae bacterium]|nr:aminopeptidase P family protein [Syntrophomonadaceae bacterium]
PKAAQIQMAKANADEIYQALKEKGLEKEPIAIDSHIPALKSLLEDMGLKFVVVYDEMEYARVIKTKEEIKCMQMAGLTADAAWGACAEYLRPGITENELAGYMAQALQGNGAQETFVVSLRTGPNTAPNYLSHSPVDRRILPGDLLTCDIIGPLYMGYRTCYYRTFKCGVKPTQKEKDMYKTIYDWLYDAMRAIKPGATTADVVKHWPSCDTWGYNEEYECWTNALGHGIGLKQYEIPAIRRSVSLEHPEVLEEGMTIAVETWLGEERIGGVRIENVIVVTDKGCENLYMWPDEEISCPQKQLIW